MTPSDKIIYSSRAWQILSRSHKIDRTAGTYLFYGPEGVGRWYLAVSFAALLNCEDVQSLKVDDKDFPLPCRSCPNCMKIFNLNFESLKLIVPIPPHENKIEKAIDFTNEIIDEKRKEPFKIISAASSTNIPVSLAREVKKSLSMRAPKGHKRVVIFYQMEKMKTSSADALLKMIEEPPPDTVIILISIKPDSLLKTIQSRSQKIKIDNNTPALISGYLKDNYDLSENHLKLLSHIASGSLGRAVDMVDISEEDQSSQRAVIFMLFKSLCLDSTADTLAHMSELLSLRDKNEIAQLLRLWQLLIRDCAAFYVTGDENEITSLDFKADIIKLSTYFSSPQVTFDIIHNIKITLADLRRNVHIQGALMALVIKIKNNIKKAS